MLALALTRLCVCVCRVPRPIGQALSNGQPVDTRAHSAVAAFPDSTSCICTRLRTKAATRTGVRSVARAVSTRAILNGTWPCTRAGLTTNAICVFGRSVISRA